MISVRNAAINFRFAPPKKTWMWRFDGTFPKEFYQLCRFTYDFGQEFRRRVLNFQID